MQTVRRDISPQPCQLTAALALFTVTMFACERVDRPPDPELVSAVSFVVDFYDWYVPSAKQGTGWPAVIRDSAHLFAPELLDDLRSDAEAQANSPDAIVGLDGDPFLDAQDFCEVYEVGTARFLDSTVVVEVHGDCSGGLDRAPDVAAELRRVGPRWVFVNFRYPQYDSDLVQVLRRLRSLRETQGRNPRTLTKVSSMCLELTAFVGTGRMQHVCRVADPPPQGRVA